MKKGKKILSILLAASVGVTGLIGSSTVYGAQKTETKQKYVVVLTRDMEVMNQVPMQYITEKCTEKKRSTGKFQTIPCRHSENLRI